MIDKRIALVYKAFISYNDYDLSTALYRYGTFLYTLKDLKNFHRILINNNDWEDLVVPTIDMLEQLGFIYRPKYK